MEEILKLLILIILMKTKTITADGDVKGIVLSKPITIIIPGFSDAEFNIVDAFGQGDKLVKHWSFKGTHDGDFFGIPATGKKVDLIGTTMVLMKDGKFFKNKIFLTITF